jgi:hypothetical protein
MPKGPKGEKRPADLNRRAFAILQIATGEAGDPDKPSPASKGGKAGGHARAKALSPEKRKAIAEKAAKARWGK